MRRCESGGENQADEQERGFVDVTRLRGGREIEINKCLGSKAGSQLGSLVVAHGLMCRITFFM